MDADEYIRVVVKVRASRHPELYGALKNNDGRAERIRSLALLGLSGVAVAGDIEPDPEGQSTNEKPANNQVKSEHPAAESPPAVNDDSVKPVATLQSEPEEDAHKDLRASVMSGVKNFSF